MQPLPITLRCFRHGLMLFDSRLSLISQGQQSHVDRSLELKPSQINCTVFLSYYETRLRSLPLKLNRQYELYFKLHAKISDVTKPCIYVLLCLSFLNETVSN